MISGIGNKPRNARLDGKARLVRSDPKLRGSHLRDGVVPKVHPGQHGEEGERPRHGGDHPASARPAEREEREVGGEEEHVLRVTGRPPVGVAGLEKLAVRRAGLRDGVLDELVEGLRDEEPRGEAEALELPAEEEVGDEPAEADEDRDEGDPRQEEAQMVARAVPDVRQRDCLQRRRHRRRHLLVIPGPGHGLALASPTRVAEDWMVMRWGLGSGCSGLGSGGLIRSAPTPCSDWRGGRGDLRPPRVVAGWRTERVVERDGRGRARSQEGRRRRVGKKENARTSTERMRPTLQNFQMIELQLAYGVQVL